MDFWVVGKGEDPICDGKMALHQLGSWVTSLWGVIRPLAERSKRALGWCPLGTLNFE